MWCLSQPCESVEPRCRPLPGLQCDAESACASAPARHCKLQCWIIRVAVQRKLPTSRAQTFCTLFSRPVAEERVFVELGLADGQSQEESIPSEREHDDLGRQRTAAKSVCLDLMGDAEAVYSWQNRADDAKLDFENLLSSAELVLRAVAVQGDRKEVLGQARFKIDEDVEAWLGTEGELTIPLVLGSRLCGQALLDVQLDCDGGTLPPRRLQNDGSTTFPTITGKPKGNHTIATDDKGGVPFGTDIGNENDEEVLQQFTAQWLAAARDEDKHDASNRLGYEIATTI
eukprot:TRINITY_DN9463_c0_g1_i2.p1 TRINITY_DN9463_c0_g1~~TRINITY_DN9463_c0_g1_i2.p1  ORF type:complete len:286 (+),score=53.07 TRINITY_DN9463_c0_g1_i2:49-906(+)